MYPPIPPPFQSPGAPRGTNALTTHDTDVLALLFSDSQTPHPSSGPSHPTILIDRTLPPSPHIHTDILPQLKQRELEAILEAEQSTPQSEESGTIGEETCTTYDDNHFCRALAAFDDLIKDFPNYASAYINRAQLRRLQFQSNPTYKATTIPPSHPTFSLIEQDLKTAIALCTPTVPTNPISTATAALLRTTYTHLATLYLLYSKATASITSDQGLSEGAMTAEQWEEKSSKAFELAGRYGSEIGKRMSVWTNPWAKACGAIVRAVLRKEMDWDAERWKRLQ